MSAPGADPLAAIRQRAENAKEIGAVSVAWSQDIPFLLKQWDTRESALRALVAQWKQEAVIADATCTCQEKLAVVLEIAHRSGEPTDKPEGMRYITISDTLARELSERARAALTPDGSTEQ